MLGFQVPTHFTFNIPDFPEFYVDYLDTIYHQLNGFKIQPLTWMLHYDYVCYYAAKLFPEYCIQASLEAIKSAILQHMIVFDMLSTLSMTAYILNISQALQVLS